MTPFEQLPRASVENPSGLKVEFPCREFTVRGGMRKHTHEYPHQPGGKREKLGRKCYEIHMVIPLYAGWPDYPIPLWPDAEVLLRTMFEKGRVLSVTVPTVGIIEASANEWSFAVTNQALNGGVLDVTFEEETKGEFLTTELLQVQAAALAPSMAAVLLEAEELGIGDLFSSLSAAVASVTGLVDQVDLYGNLVAAKAEGIANQCNALCESADALQKPENHAVVEATHNVWAAALQLHKDALKRAVPLIEFPVPTLMHIADVSRAVYGSSDRAVEILKLNPIEDALAIPRGTILRVYAPEQRLAA